jgi:hypothetical protein
MKEMLELILQSWKNLTAFIVIVFTFGLNLALVLRAFNPVKINKFYISEIEKTQIIESVLEQLKNKDGE